MVMVRRRTWKEGSELKLATRDEKRALASFRHFYGLNPVAIVTEYDLPCGIFLVTDGYIRVYVDTRNV